MRLLVDLYPCQTESRYRGIGRYTLSLVREMARLRGSNDLYALADAQFPEGFEELRQQFIRLLPAGAFLPYYRNAINFDSPVSQQSQKQIAETLIRQAYQTLAPDIVLTPSPFEVNIQGIVPSPLIQGSTYKQVAVLFDLIPYLFHEQYLDNNPEFNKSYVDTLNNIPNYDLLLAISEATRQDAIRILNIAPDKIVNISGATSGHFRKLELSNDEKKEYLHHFGITRPFILYIGGNNFRKNMEGALRAFAQLPRSLINSHQLVINDAGDEKVFRTKARSLGFSDDDIIITGYTSDDELVALYNLCKVFIFPSLYEGFGLPILEAMACGAPVIAANNSSLPEVVGRSDALFDASDDQSIATALNRVLTDDPFRQDLAAFGLERSRQFSWENSARTSWEAMEFLLEKPKGSKPVVLTKGSKRPRIAFVSPLPPQKSGISYYSADLLPYLAKHFEIDLFVDQDVSVSDAYLKRNFSIYPWNKLIEMRDRYETVVYQFGNSPFHAHMFDLESKFPGVVVLHEFYLSDLVGYVFSPLGTFEDEVNYSHGLKGVIDYQIKKRDMLWDWPINRRVIRKAGEIIVHSNYQNILLKKFYGKGWLPTTTVIKQPRVCLPEVNNDQRLKARKELGIGRDEFIFCTFGLLNPLKLNEMIVQAYSLVLDELGKDTKFIFVGDSSTSEYHKQFVDLLRQLGLSDKVRVTGYVDDETYKKYLISANAAIQLRTNSRGETSAAVIDCMNNGLPLIINANGALDDYSAEDVVKIADPVQLDELSAAMIRIRKDEAFRVEMGKRARNVIEEQHEPNMVAAAYAEVIHRAIIADDRKIFTPLIDVLLRNTLPDGQINALSKFAANNLSLRSQPRLLVDVSTIATSDARSGIQRVVRSIVREFFAMDDPSLIVEPIRISDGRIVRASRYIESLLHLPEQSLGPENLINIMPGDNLFMLDSTWHLYDQFFPLFEQVRKNGGKVVTAIYDLIPVRFPEVVDSIMEMIFEKWLKNAIAQSDMLVCISCSTADDVKNYIAETNTVHKDCLDIEYFHLGSDIPVVDSESKIRLQVKMLTEDPVIPLFLMVGTIEPRKGHNFALDAFEKLWQQGYDYRLCFAGKVGWHVDELAQRIHSHAELGKRLFFFENPSDGEINQLYLTATALITASKAEGFGLPIIEAAQRQVPVLASDIPVFHEVGGEGTVYFSLNTPAYLADAVQEMAAKTPAERVALAKKVKCLSWKESADWILDILEHSREHKEILHPERREILR